VFGHFGALLVHLLPNKNFIYKFSASMIKSEITNFRSNYFTNTREDVNCNILKRSIGEQTFFKLQQLPVCRCCKRQLHP
jgi:hypothetical protein